MSKIYHVYNDTYEEAVAVEKLLSRTYIIVELVLEKINVNSNIRKWIVKYKELENKSDH